MEILKQEELKSLIGVIRPEIASGEDKPGCGC